MVINHKSHSNLNPCVGFRFRRPASITHKRNIYRVQAGAVCIMSRTGMVVIGAVTASGQGSISNGGCAIDQRLLSATCKNSQYGVKQLPQKMYSRNT